MRRILMLAAAAIAAMAGAPAEARDPAAKEAKHACRQAARAQYGATGFDHLTAANRGGGAFEVTGTMMRSGQSNAILRCSARYGRVERLSLRDGGGGSGDNAGAAIGAALGVAVGAAILGAISSDHSHDDWRAPAAARPQSHGRGYSPTRNITCYRRQRACYHVSGRFAPEWTDREFGAASTPNRPRGRGYSPARNITCYRRERACYHVSGRAAPRWTDREFGRATQLPSPPPPRVDEGQLRMYCAGEASSRFHVHPRDIRIDDLTRSRDAFTVYGSFFSRGGRSRFICRFDAAGGFRFINRA